MNSEKMEAMKVVFARIGRPWPFLVEKEEAADECRLDFDVAGGIIGSRDSEDDEEDICREVTREDGAGARLRRARQVPLGEEELI